MLNRFKAATRKAAGLTQQTARYADNAFDRVFRAESLVQLTLSLYMVGFAIAQRVCADHDRRRHLRYSGAHVPGFEPQAG